MGFKVRVLDMAGGGKVRGLEFEEPVTMEEILNQLDGGVRGAIIKLDGEDVEPNQAGRTIVDSDATVTRSSDKMTGG